MAGIGGSSNLADFSLRRRRATLAVAGLFTVIAAVLGIGVAGHLTQGGSDAPSEESVHAASVLASQFRIVTSAALLMSVVFLGQLASGIASIKLFGLSVSLAVLVDAFVVRGLLVPAVMKLLGRANWWAPRWLEGAALAADGSRGSVGGFGGGAGGRAVPGVRGGVAVGV